MRKGIIVIFLMAFVSCKKRNNPTSYTKEVPGKTFSYFPASIKDSLNSKRISEALNLLNEPSLLNERESGKTIYRYTNIGTVGGPSIIRVEKVNDSVYYYYHKVAEIRYNASDKPEYEIVHNLEGKVYQFLGRRFAFDSLEKKLEKINFWNLPIDIAWNYKGGDGENYIIEGLKDGRYHVITRWSPEAKDNPFPQAKEFINLYEFFDDLYFVCK